MQNPFFSIVIPTLNEEQYVPRLLNDLSRQSNTDFEVIIVDSSSTDNTIQKANQYKTLLNLQIFIVKRKNVSYQRNTGAKKAHGDYVIFIDADSRVDKNFIKKVKNRIIKDKGLILLPQIVPDQSTGQLKVLFSLINMYVEMSQYLGKPLSLGGCMIWDRYFFYKVGGFEEHLFIAEDHNIIQKAHKWGVHPKFIHDVKATYSLRRVKKEGEWKLTYKYLKAMLHVYTKGDVKNKIFEYEMGGHLYNNKYLRRQLDKTSEKQFLKQLKESFKKILQEP